MSVVAGVDIGSTTAKCVVLGNDARVLGKSLNVVGVDIVKDAERALEAALADAHLSRSDLSFITGTGYGRYKVYFGQLIVTEISCHARGANHLFPGTRLVVDIGGQDTKAIRINDKGEVVDFAMNDKCAAGTGRFLDVCANALGYDVGEIRPLSLQARRAVKITSTLYGLRGIRGHVVRLERQGPEGYPRGAARQHREPNALLDAAGRRGARDHLHGRRLPERGHGAGPPPSSRGPRQCEPSLTIPRGVGGGAPRS